MTRRWVRFGAAALLVASTTAGCSVKGIRGSATTEQATTVPTTTTTTPSAPTSAVPTTTTNPAPPYPLPAQGECRGITGDDVAGASVDGRLTISCDQPHGTETVLVIADALVALTEYPEDRFALPPGLHTSVATACQAAFDAYLGLPPLGTAGRAASRLVPAWFLPPSSSWDLGARFVRCDAIVEPVPGQGGRYAGPLRGALAGGEVPAALAACYDTGLRLARCDAGHVSESVADAVFAGAVERPGPEAVAAARAEQCDAAAAAAIGVGTMAEQPLLTTALILPSRDAWAIGVRVGTCHVVAADGRSLDDSVRSIGPAPPALVTIAPLETVAP